MSKHEPQSEGMNALEQSLNDHMEICRLKRKAKRLKAENARLKADVELLRKAGDAMANWFRPVAGVESLPAHIVYDAWNAAKEGMQS